MIDCVPRLWASRGVTASDGIDPSLPCDILGHHKV